MSSLRVLAFSSSRVGGTGYLETAVPVIKKFLGSIPLRIAFIPFATADNDYQTYLANVQEALSALPHTIVVATHEDAQSIIEHADVIMVGGGNTFKLLHHLYRYRLMDLIKEKVNNGTPYIGWSAGANIAGATIGTTNDMPVIEPESFKAFGFFPFQINPHYVNQKPAGHNGETRDERLFEYLKINLKSFIVALPEGTALQLEQGILKLAGDAPAMLFKNNSNSVNPIRVVIESNADLSYLL